MNRKRWPILCAIAIFAVAILFYTNFQKKHTFALANDEGMIKAEQIQPIFGTVKVSGDCDTDVVFTDMETGEKYVVSGDLWAHESIVSYQPTEVYDTTMQERQNENESD